MFLFLPLVTPTDLITLPYPSLHALTHSSLIPNPLKSYVCEAVGNVESWWGGGLSLGMSGFWVWGGYLISSAFPTEVMEVMEVMSIFHTHTTHLFYRMSGDGGF